MKLNVLQQDQTLLFGISFLALSVDHPLSKYYKDDPEFIKFKKNCSATGTTEESIATC